jgi:hypothetical protein
MGLFSLIPFSGSSLLVYRKVNDFCMLIMYSATLLKEVINLKVFWWNLWGLLNIGSFHLQTGIV